MIVDTGNNSGEKSTLKVTYNSYVELTRSNPGKNVQRNWYI